MILSFVIEYLIERGAKVGIDGLRFHKPLVLIHGLVQGRPSSFRLPRGDRQLVFKLSLGV